MSNPFKDWTAQDVQRFNQKVAGTPPDSAVPGEPKQPSAARVVIQPSTDEQKLNKTERAWLNVLRSRSYPKLRIQAHTLKLGHDCRYTPDFSALGPNDELIFWEVKGFMRDDARVKLMVAAREFSEYRFYLVTRTRGIFEETLIQP